MKKVELLAPVGSYQALCAAINAGCDAVYLSGYMFGARQFAPNFSDGELVEAIKLSHIYGVKVYVTVNTLIKENEVETFLDYIDFLHKNNVDAVIMQDLGMIDLVRKMYPNLEVHASTQLHIHNLEGVKFCKELGLKRVVLARETNIELIEEIRKSSDIEIEVFVHGALCVSYSGQCLMSSLIGGRSGNRGACAGTCRLPYKLIDESGKKLNDEDYVLSMKDLCTLEHIKELIESGVDSFKIEGRMKRPEYVYLVVSLYRKAIDSYYETGNVEFNEEELDDLRKIFNRKFTSGFLFNEKNDSITNSYRPNHLGVEIGKIISSTDKFITIKLNSDLNIGDGIRIVESDLGCTVTNLFIDKKKVSGAKAGDVVSIPLTGNIRNNSVVVKTTDINQIKSLKEKIDGVDKKISVSGNISLKIGEPLKLELSDSKNKVIVFGAIVEKAMKAPMDCEQIKKQISKLGETPFILEYLEIIKDDNIFINNRDLNELRRNAVEQLINLRLYQINYLKDEYKIEVPDFNSGREFNVLIEDSSFYNDIKDKNIDYIYTNDIDLVNNEKDNRLILKLPRVINDSFKYNYPLMIGELGSLKQKQKKIGDFSLNVFNSYTVAFLHSVGVEKITLSYELLKSEIKELIDGYKKRYNKTPNLEVIIYGKEEMMVSKFNLNKLYRKDFIYLVDRFNNKYPVKENNGLMYIYNHKPRILEKLEYYDLGVNAVRINILDKDDLSWYLSK